MQGRRAESFLVSVGFALLLIPEASRAAEDRWMPLGPGGGDVQAIAVAPSRPQTMYAGTNFGGVFRSTDGGVTWRAANGGLGDRDVRSLAVDPRSPDIVYVGLAYGGIFRSVDGGSSWIARNTGLSGIAIYGGVGALAIDPSSPETLYAANFYEGVFKSEDAGATWKPVGGAVVLSGAVALAVDPARPSTLYVGTFGYGVYQSTDAGASWAEVFSGYALVRSVVIDPTSPATVYVGFDTGRVARSTDRGASWTLVSDGAIPGDVTALAIDPNLPATIYAATAARQAGGGVFRSRDSGGTWTAMGGVEVGTVNALVAAPGFPAKLYAGAFAQGLLISDDGTRFREQNAGLNAVPVTAVAVDAVDPSALYVSRADRGVSRSLDGGQTWKLVSESLPPYGIDAVAADPAMAGVVYAGSSWAGVFKSTDHGESWSKLTRGLPDYFFVIALAFAPAAPAALYAGTLGAGVYRSTDGGRNWSAASSDVGVGSVPSFAFDPSAPGTIYAPTFVAPGPCPLYCDIPPGVIARTIDSGDHWTTLPALEDVAAVAVDPVSPETLYASVHGGEGIYKSLDSGAHWALHKNGLEGVSISALATAAGPPSIVYAGSAGSGAFRSSDGGATWSAMSVGLKDRRIRFLASPDRSGALYAGTNGGGLYRLERSAAPTCSPSPTSFCVGGGRFRVEVSWSASNLGQSGPGQAMPLTADTGAFWFFQPSNIELVVKVLDGRAINGHFWVFYGALTNVGYTITATDTATGASRTYTNPEGQIASGADTEAF